MKNLLIVIGFVVLLAATITSQGTTPPIYQFSNFTEIHKINGAYTPTVQVSIQYGFTQMIDSALWGLSLFEVAGAGHNFSNGGVVINSLPVGVGFIITPNEKNGVSYGGGADHDFYNNQTFAVINIRVTVKVISDLVTGKLAFAKRRNNGFIFVY